MSSLPNLLRGLASLSLFAGVISVAVSLSAPAGAETLSAQMPFSWPVVYPEPKLAWPVVYPNDTVSVLLAGDTGFGGHRQPVRDGYGMRHGRALTYHKMTKGIVPLLTADAAFANLETVVTDNNRLRPAGKRFVFKTHPSAVAHLNDIGFNLFATSNNHVGDYGIGGIRQTLNNLADLKKDGREFAASGLGYDRDDAAKPKTLKIKSADLHLSAIGIGGGNANGRGRPSRAGHLHYRTAHDFQDAVEALSAKKSGIRMLSVHYGEERQIYPSTHDVIKLRDKVIREADIDLVIGHHAHVPRGVARVDGKLVFYGLGNFLHPGMQNMARFDRCRDFGVVARVHFGRISPTRYRALAVEVIPVTDMHQSPRPLPVEKSKIRIGVLNGLARGLDAPEHQSEGVRFSARDDGRGVACFEGAEQMRGQVAKLCGEQKISSQLQDENTKQSVPTVGCSGGRYQMVKNGVSAAQKRRRFARQRRAERRKKVDYFNPFGF